MFEEGLRVSGICSTVYAYHVYVHTHMCVFSWRFAYRLLRADNSVNQSCHKQGRQLGRLGLCWFHVWPLASDGLAHS